MEFISKGTKERLRSNRTPIKKFHWNIFQREMAVKTTEDMHYGCTCLMEVTPHIGCKDVGYRMYTCNRISIAGLFRSSVDLAVYPLSISIWGY